MNGFIKLEKILFDESGLCFKSPNGKHNWIELDEGTEWCDICNTSRTK